MSSDYYESERGLSEYLLFHFGAREQVLPWAFGPADALEFPKRCVEMGVDFGSLPLDARALDLGCAVGGASFHLARRGVRVIGVDLSERFIRIANVLKQQGKIEFEFIEEGDLTRRAEARLPEGIDRSKLEFRQGDALALPPGLGCFDLVVLFNLIDRLPDPASLLRKLGRLVTPGGQLVLASPYTWLEAYTPRASWLGGIPAEDRPIRAFQAIEELLAPDFLLAALQDLPFLLREHARKYQWSVAQLSRWIRKKSPLSPA